MNTTKKQSAGFTVPELIVAMVVASIMVATLVAVIVSWSQQFSVTSVRQTLNTDAQAAVARINDDIRNSSGVALYNAAPDPNAPTSLIGEFDNVPDPETMAAGDTKYNWRIGENRLIITQPARKTDGTTIYSNASTFTGPVNTIIYYVNNSTLYRRVVAAVDPQNSISTQTCAVVASGGCVLSDIKIAGSLDSSDGLGSFVVKYYDVGGEEIPNRVSGTPDYTGYLATRMISVDLKLNRAQVGQTLVENRSGKMQFRTEPAKQVAQEPVLNASITAGPGGIYAYWYTNIRGVNVKTQGDIEYRYNAKFGTKTQPIYVSAANKKCGSGATYGTVLCGSQPIDMFWNSNMYGDVCATGQTSQAGIVPGNVGTLYTKGRIANCVAEDVIMPKFDKAAHTASMTQTLPASTASCNNVNGMKPTSTLEANTTYEGDVNLVWNCVGTIKGNIHIKGDLNINYGATLKVDSDKQPVITVDGSIDFFWGANVEPKGNIAPYFISFLSSDNGCTYSSPTCCSKSPTCNSIPNATLQSSVNQDAISFRQSIDAPYSMFYAYYGKLETFWSDLKVGAVAGQRVEFKNSGAVTLTQ